MNKGCPLHQEGLVSFAVRFLQRHHSAHLTYDYLLDRAAVNLRQGFILSEQESAHIVELAFKKFMSVRRQQKVDAARSTQTHVVVVDPETGATWSIPVAVIFERIIGSPDSTRYRIANT